jgi:hypothetical protein
MGLCVNGRGFPLAKREMQGQNIGASHAVLGQLLRSWGIALAVALFLAMSGAMGTGELPLWRRLAYWTPIMLIVTPIGLVAEPMSRRMPFLEGRAYLQWAVLSVLLALPITVVVWLYTSVFFGYEVHLRRLIDFAPSTLLVTAAMTGITLLTDKRGAVTHAAPPEANATRAPPRARFMERLPAKVMGGALHAVKAEDHYLRLYTSKGEDLILMRLTDAIAELEGIEGAQTHRSWWVAKDAVHEVRRADGKFTLMLTGGVEAPVSRANVKALREEGWI